MTDTVLDPRIQEIVDAILKISAGDFSTDLRPSLRRDDIDAIMVGIKAMAVRLAASYGELDQRVQQRTALLEAARDRLEVLAFTDQLTSLANRAALLRAMESHLDSLRRQEPPATLFLLDLDAFKPINDTHGHNAGDRVLEEIARRLEASIRPGDMAARLGGDEFAILARVDVAGARALGLRLLKVLNRPVDIEDATITPGGSIGFCAAHESLGAGEWLECADTAMYVAKRESKDKVQQFEDYMLFERHRKARLSSDLRTALDNSELYPIYQPILDGETGTELGVEALARWEHPALGVLSPAVFLPLAVESGLMSRLTRQLLDRSLEELQQWRQDGAVPRDFRVQVNVAPEELSDLAFPDMINEHLRKHGIPPECLVIEVTEDRYISGDRLELYSLHALRAQGVRVFIDDFGAGYSSFGYLSKLPIAGVKIDRSITYGIDTDPRQCAVMKSVLDLAAACELECIVEGVETQQQAEALKDIGSPNTQGYLYGWPGPYISPSQR